MVHRHYHRLLNPQEVKSGWMLLIASLGLAVNLASAYFLHGSQSASLNVRSAFLRDRFQIEHSTIQLEERSLEHEEMGTRHSVVR